MSIIKKITELETSVKKTELLVDEMMLYFVEQKIKNNLKENKILELKEKVAINVQKIDEIIEKYNGNT